jgi:hypothetical protein
MRLIEYSVPSMSQLTSLIGWTFVIPALVNKPNCLCSAIQFGESLRAINSLTLFPTARLSLFRVSWPAQSAQVQLFSARLLSVQ